ncbi:CCE_0567 family metalloprotein [Methylocella sp.]|uniref:CCE_0567 family metalloprotein n=1 Tax=Methylocella sp. TaxID=1978226 RepID=UPI003C139080
MSSIEEVKAEIKKLSPRATNMKMALHDLSEDLPINWTTIMTVAKETYDAYAALEAARQRLKALEDA